MRSLQSIEDAVHTHVWLLEDLLKRRDYARCDVLLKELQELRREHENTSFEDRRYSQMIH